MTNNKYRYILAHKHWMHIPAGRWAIATHTGAAPTMRTFVADEMVVINGAVCMPVAKAAGLALRDAFEYAGTWYIRETDAWFTGTDADGRMIYKGYSDMTRAKLLACA